MAKSFTPQDCYKLMNSLVKQATGQQTITVVDSSTFVSAGETVLSTGTENVLNSLSIIIARTLVAVRPYKAKFMLMEYKSMTEAEAHEYLEKYAMNKRRKKYIAAQEIIDLIHEQYM